MYSSDGYNALRERSGVVRRGDRGVLEVGGSDRLQWLQGLLTNDVAALPPESVRYAAYLTPQGRMLSDMRVVNLADRTWLEVPALLTEQLRARLDALIFTEDASVADISAATAAVDVHGPDAKQAVNAARGSLPPGSHAIEDDVFGVPGVTLYVPFSQAEAVVRALVDAGAAETNLETLDVLRVEAGIPLFLVDMDEHTIPLEAGIEDRAVSFTKGCYVGQEVIVRVMQRGGGRVAKRLRGLVFAKDATPRPGDLVSAGDREIGRITSAVWSPACRRPIALAYLHRDFTDPGSSVTVRTTAGPAAASVTEVPFCPR